MRSLQPSRVIQAILAAQAAGRTAAEAALRELRLRHGEREQYDASAGAVMHLLLRRTSTLARDLEDLSRSLNWLFSVIPSGGSGPGPVKCREVAAIHASFRRPTYRDAGVVACWGE